MSTNLKHLKEVQYKDLTKLNKRWKTYEYMQPYFDIYDMALEKLNLTGGENILEVGCADGKVLKKIYDKGHKGKLIGLDIHKFNKEKNKNIKYIAGNAQKINFEDKSFDMVLSFFMIYHMENPKKAIKEWLRLLGRGGKIVITAGTSKNKIKIKGIKNDAAKKFNKQIYRITDSCNFDNLVKMLQEFSNIKILYKKIYKSRLYINDSKIILDALESTKDTFKPISKKGEWKSIYEYVKNKVDKDIEKNGYFIDNVDRGVLIIEKLR